MLLAAIPYTKSKKIGYGSLKLKGRVSPHGNEDNLKDILNKDFSTCPPTGLRMVKYIASLYGWTIYKSDVKAAFLATGKEDRDLYVGPPVESSMKVTHMWLLLTAVYGLVNSNAKWKNQSDEIMIDLRLAQSKYVPQLFF